MLLTIQHLDFAYQDEWIFKDWSASLRRSEICHLKGANGEGKSTLLRIIAGILRPHAGDVLVNLSHGYKNKIAYVGHRLGLHPNLSVRENLCYGFSENNVVDMHQYLDELQLHHCLDKETHILSQGQAHKIALIQMLLYRSQLWLLDEPFANLDDAGEQWLWDKIKAHQDQKGAIIFTAHQKHVSNVVEWQL
jgi:heme exporter protein A